jgi:RecB family exonuclease
VDGGLLLVDYKTGAPISDSKKDATRRQHLLAQIAQGRRLQGPAYARAGRAGRYVFAREGLEPASALVEIAHDDAIAGARFDEAARDLLGAFEQGAFPPRLLGEARSGKGPACDRCDVAEACVFGESGSAQHLARWITRHEEDREGLSEAAAAALALLLRVEKQ